MKNDIHAKNYDAEPIESATVQDGNEGRSQGRQAARARNPDRSRPANPGSKTVQLVRLLSGKTGADVVTVGRKLGWQAHTTRAAITGLRKAGYAIAYEKGVDGKLGRYCITGTPAATGGK